MTASMKGVISMKGISYVPLRGSGNCFLFVGFLLALTIQHVARAQGSSSYCEPSPAIKDGLKTASIVIEEDLSYKEQGARRLTILQELLKKYPRDVHILKRYQDSRRYAFNVDREALRTDYRNQLEQSPNDPIAVYLYSRLLVGYETTEAIELLEKLAQQSPGFPWIYLELAQIYNYPNFRDAAKSRDNLKKWVAACPLATEGFLLISRTNDLE
jgi:hypothetical protein